MRVAIHPEGRLVGLNDLHMSRELHAGVRGPPSGLSLQGPSQGPKETGMEEEFLAEHPDGCRRCGDISEEEILETVREHRSGRKKLPEITVVARTKKKTA